MLKRNQSVIGPAYYRSIYGEKAVKSLLVLMPLLLTGCASERGIYTPDGRPGVVLNCSGWARSWDMCFAKAGEICGTMGYDVFDKNGERVFVGLTPVTNRSMVIACKPLAPPH